MTDRPIIFSGSMVRALLARSKTQTRRLTSSPLARCQVGDRLWVRESWLPNIPREGTWPWADFERRGGVPASAVPEHLRLARHCLFLATWRSQPRPDWKPAFYLPRWGSRLTLTVTGVRRHQLDDISEPDAVAEGLSGVIRNRLTRWGIPDGDGTPGTGEGGWPEHRWTLDPRDAYKGLWADLHPRAKPNPEVVAITFRVVERNINEGAAHG